ncbi:MAG: hypothetical protein M1828_001690 [Chrysothrix sp. TS-e1954]|nr:MAG: hypothetical protein M1828_001690 [Chrysothrix sp. TS-e1954]
MAQDAPNAPSGVWRGCSALVIGTVGFISRSFLLYGNRLEVNGLPDFLALLDERKDVTNRSRGLITVSNHLSVIDDPLMWGVLPYARHWQPDNMRWSLGSHDIVFKNKLFTKFFHLGQVLPTHRIAHSEHGGLWQPTILQAIRLLSRRPMPVVSDAVQASHDIPDPFTWNQLTYTTTGDDLVPSPSAYLNNRFSWVHVHPEGKIHQKNDKTMRYFKWGVSRLILESEPCPDLVPIWIEGFDDVMHESREFPRFIPRVGKNVSVTFGSRVSMDDVFGDLRSRWKAIEHRVELSASRGEQSRLGALFELRHGENAVELREECTLRVREQVLQLRRQRGWSDEDPKARLVDTWRREGLGKREGIMADGSWVRE